MHQGYANVPGARIWYHDSGGAGIPVILLHAGHGHAEYFDRYQIPAFAAAGYRVVAYDRRGHGRSCIDPSGPQPGTAVDDLHALANVLAIDDFSLVGTAAGGIVAIDYAITYPERLRSLVIANSIVATRDPEYLELRGRLRPPEFERLPNFFKELGPEYRAANPEGVRQWLELEQHSRAAGAPSQSQAPVNRTSFEALQALQVPALMLTGDADLYSPPTLVKLFARRLPNARFASLPAVGHSAFWEQPEAFNRLVLDFIAAHQ